MKIIYRNKVFHIASPVPTMYSVYMYIYRPVDMECVK